MASCVRTIHEQRRAHTLLRALCCSERASTASVGRPVYRCRLTSYFTFYFCSAKSTPPRARTKEVSTAPGLPSLRLACLTHARCPAPCTRAHAKQSTLDTHAARMRASTATRTCTHTATCAHTSKAFCGSSCHWQLADCRPARC